MQNVTMQPSLEALQAQQGATQTADVSAFANKGIDLESTPAADTLELSAQEQPKKKGGVGKLLLGAAAIGAIGFGIFKWVKGKGGKTVDLEDLSKLKEHLANNKNFTGAVTGKVGKAGDTAKLVYKKGVLQQSTKFDKEGKEILSKTFEILEDGSKKITTKKGDITEAVKHVVKDGKLSAIQTLDKEGKEIADKTKVFEYFADGEAKGLLSKYTNPANKQVTALTYQKIGEGENTKIAKQTLTTVIDG